MAAHARSESARRVSDCVTALLRDQPFFGSLALRLPIRADATRETLASDGKDIRYAPQWVADTDADHIKTALARVVLACALKHHTRRRGRDPERWQRVLFRTLVDDGFPGLFPGLVAWISNVISSLPDRDEPLAMPRSMIACWGCRLAGSASSRFAAPPLRCGPSGDPLPSIRRGAAMAVRQAFGHWPNPRREGVERRRCRWWRGRCGAVVPVPFNA